MTWPETRFDTLFAAPTRNGIYKPKEFHGTGCRMVNMGELFGFDFIGRQPMERVQLTDAELETSGLVTGDLLFGRRSLVEAGAGKCSLVVDATDPLSFESSIIRVRMDSMRANPRFYYYWFRSPLGRGRIRSIVSGTNVKGIRSSDLKALDVAAPPRATQDRVVDVLTAYDDLIENNSRRMTLLEDAARQLYQEWFVRLRFPGREHAHVVDGVPKGWVRASLGDLADIVMGQSPESAHYNEDGDGLPFHQGVADFGDRFVTHRVYCTEENRIAEAGDILCSVRAPVGRLNVTPERIVIGRGLAALRSNMGTQSLLYQQLKAHFHEEDLIGGGTIFASVTKKEFTAQTLLNPTLNIATAFEEITRPLDRQLHTLTRVTARLCMARDLLLTRLMNGEVAA